MLFNIMYSSCYFEPHFQHCSQTEMGKSSSKYKRSLPVGISPLYFPSVLFFLNASLPFVLVTSHGLVDWVLNKLIKWLMGGKCIQYELIKQIISVYYVKWWASRNRSLTENKFSTKLASKIVESRPKFALLDFSYKSRTSASFMAKFVEVQNLKDFHASLVR